MFECDEDAKKAAEKLDEYNFKDILQSCYDSGISDPIDIRDHIIDNHYPELDETFGDLTGDEWMEYLCYRYPIKFEEIISYRMWYRK